MSRWSVLACVAVIVTAPVFGQGSCGSITDTSAYIGFYGSTTGCTPAHNTCSVSDSLTFSVYPQNGWAFSCAPFLFAWNFGDGQASTVNNPVHQYASNGTFNVSLVITDGSGKSATFTGSVIVNGGSPPPNPNPNPNPNGCASLSSQSAYIGFYGSSTGCTPTSQTCTTADLVTFNTYAQNGYSFNCSPYSYYWNFGDGRSSTNAQPSHQYGSGGTYNLSLLLQDSQGHSATISGSIHVAGGSNVCAPITPQSAYVGFYGGGTGCTPANDICTNAETITFTLYPQNGYSFTCSPYSYMWNFGDGRTSSTEQPSHQYTTAGTYNLSVAIVDGVSNSAQFSRSLTISGPAPSNLSITGLVPAAGPASGATTVFVIGTGFQPGATVSFGGVSAVTGFVSSTSLVTATPPHSGGQVDVIVMNSDGGRAVLRNAFTFVEACTPPFIGVQPTSVVIPRGTSASLTVEVSGAEPLTFQWYEGLPGDTSSLIPDGWRSYITVSPSRTTTYWVHVTNSCGSAVSSAAQVTVVSPRRRSTIH